MRRIAKLIRYFGWLLFSFSCLNPLIENQNKNFFPSYIPGVNTNTTTVFWILYFLQMPIIYLAIVIMLAHVYMFLSFIVFGTSQIQILNFKIKQLNSTKNDGQSLISENVKMKLKENLIACIKDHQEIKR